MTTDLRLAEIGALRSEINSVIDRMNGNENFSAGTISAIFAFILTHDITLVSLVLALLTLIVVFIGTRRSDEMRNQIRNVDMYLKEIEQALSANGGWTTHYYKSLRGTGYSETRSTFWSALGAVSAFGTLYVLYRLENG